MPNAPSTRYPSRTDYHTPSITPPTFDPARKYRYRLDDKVMLSPEAVQRMSKSTSSNKAIIDKEGVITNLPGHFPGLPSHCEVLFSNGQTHVLGQSSLRIIKRAKAWVPMHLRK